MSTTPPLDDFALAARSTPLARFVLDAIDASAAGRITFAEFMARWKARLGRQKQTMAEAAGLMRSVNPAFIPRNHRIEQAIEAAVDRDDFGRFRELLSVLEKPYEEQPQFARYRLPPLQEERVLQTFCGT